MLSATSWFRKTRGSVRLWICLILAGCGSVPVYLWADAPSWWATRGVINSEATADDYAAVNQGQVKHIAKQAYEEMKAKLPGGAGSGLDAIWASPSASADDYMAVNIGQLKNVAKPFYDRLGQAYPWGGSSAPADDYALANIGQVKNLFSFSFGAVAQSYYLTILSGNHQVGSSGEVLPQALRVRVTDAEGQLVAGQVVTFTINSGAGGLSESVVGGTILSFQQTTGVGGEAEVFLKPIGVPGAVVTVSAAIDGGHSVFTAYLGGDAVSSVGDADAPEAMVGEDPDSGGDPEWTVNDLGFTTPGSPDFKYPTLWVVADWYQEFYGDEWYQYEWRQDWTRAALNWTDGSFGPTSYRVEVRIDGGDWESIQDMSGSRAYIHEGLVSGRLYEYRVCLLKQQTVLAYSNVMAYDVPRVRQINYNVVADGAASGGEYSLVGSSHGVGVQARHDYQPITFSFFMWGKYEIENFDVTQNDSASLTQPLMFVRRVWWGEYEVYYDPYYDENTQEWVPSLSFDGSTVESDQAEVVSIPSDVYLNPAGVAYVDATTWEEAEDSSGWGEINWTGSSAFARYTCAEVCEYIPYYVWFEGAKLSCYSLPEEGLKWEDGAEIIIERPDYKLTDVSPLALTWSSAGSSDAILLYRQVADGSGWSAPAGPLAGGAQLQSGERFVIRLNPAEASLETVTLTLTDSDEENGVSTQIKYAHREPQPGANIPLSESSGAKYRKIALNGAPLSDEKPQQEAETDQAREETFIDALTLGLRHDTTDAYMAVPASDLFLGARRSATTEIWTNRRGLRPNERPDRPFGTGWSTNLAASIQFSRMLGSAAGNMVENPDTATVTDENGASYEFAIIYGPGTTYSTSAGYSGTMKFVPLPTSKHEQGTHLNTLEKVGENYVFKRKFGSTLTYAMSSLRVMLPSDRIDGSSGGQDNTWARLASVVDRYGNALDYAYSALDTLIPATITVRKPVGTATVLSIRQNDDGLITDIWDPLGYKVSYTYDSEGDTHQLTKVTASDGKETRYEYTIYDEIRDVPESVDSHDEEPKHHLNLTKITDPLNRSYEFEYEFDTTKFDYTGAPDSNGPLTGQNYYVKAGVPMWVSQVTLPNEDVATFSNTDSTVRLERNESTGALEFSGTRRSRVIDAEGNERVYDFTNTQVEEMESFATIYHRQPKIDVPRMIFYRTMEITSYEGSGVSKTELGSESFTFLPDAGMALASTTDFSGNTTTYAYTDTFVSTLSADTGVSSTLFGRYSDPTSQTNALNKTKHFTYGTNRIMTSSTDEVGVKTEWTVDTTTGRRLNETVKDADDTLVQETTFYYKDTVGAYLDGTVNYTTVSKNFLTKKVVKKLAGVTEPGWVQDLVTVYVPDSDSRLAKEIVDPSGLALTTEYTYDANGNKRTSKDPRGNVTTFSYDKRNRLTHVTYADHHQKRFYYDARGNKTAEIDENDVATFWQYDVFNRVKNHVVDMDGSLKALAAATNYVLADTVTLDRSVHVVTSYTYNNLNAKETVVGPKLTKTSTDDWRTTTTKFEYDALQRLKKKTDDYGSTSEHLNYVTTYDYDLEKNPGGSVFDSTGWKPTKVTGPRTYLIEGNPVPGKYITEVTYDALYRPVEEAVQYGPDAYAVTTKHYDDVGNLLEVTAPPATVNGVLQSSGTVTKTIYDALRRPTSVTEGHGLADLAATTTTDYTSTGLAWRTVAEVARTPAVVTRTTTTEYDAAGRPVKVFAPAVDDALTTDTAWVTPVTETRYDAAGNVSYVINPLGQRTDYTYDTRNRRYEEKLPAVTDATSGVASHPTRTTAYDGVGNVIAVQDARGFVTSTEYDNARRPRQVTAPPMTKVDGTTVNPITTSIYDTAGNVLTLTDANGHVTINTYDALGRLETTLQKPDSNEEHDILVRNEYDAAGNRTAVIDGKLQRTEFAYDGLNRNTSVKDPAFKLVTFTYDAINKIARIDSENKLTFYLYDARHRLTDVTYHVPEAEDQLPGVTYVDRTQDNRHYDYDLASQLLGVTEPGKSGKADVAYTYDALGRQLTETSGGKTHTYGYDLANNRVTVTYGGTGAVLTSTYDALNRLETLTENSRVTTYGYDLNGNRVYQELPNGEEVDTQYDPLNRAATITTSKASGALLLQLLQAYDPVGNLVQLTERHYGSALVPRTVTNTYDNVNRLVTEVNVEGAKTIATTYGFDTANNRVAKAVATTTGSGTALVETAYVYNNLNQLQTATEGSAVTSFSYDANGNRSTRTKDGQTDTYAYDYENRLLSLDKDTTGGAGSYTYVYDYRTRRVSRTEASTTTDVVFSGGVSVAEYEGSSATVEYVRGSDWGGGVGGLLYSVRSSVPSFKHYNSRGDVISETNTLGSATWQGTYEAFGTRTQEVGSTQDRQKANTKEEDPTGLLNEGFRYRDLETGVFITRDPLGFVDGPNMYAYVVQNPWSKFDPLGLSPDVGPANLAERQRLATDLVSAAGSGTEGDKQLVVQKLMQLSPARLNQMKKHSLGVKAVRGSVTDFDKSLKGVQPRGWPAGATWDNVPGMARGKNAVVAVIGHDQGKPHVPEKGEGHGSVDVVLHETGHVITSDHVGDVSLSAFKDAYIKDKETLSAYQRQPGLAGAEEAYAESFARYYSNDPTLKAKSPNLYQYFDNWESQNKEKKKDVADPAPVKKPDPKPEDSSSGTP